MADITPDLEQARRFLHILDPNADVRSLLEDRPDGFTFQTFDDDKKRKDKSLARVATNTFDKLAEGLVRLNQRGAGIFVTVNETDGKGRRLANLTRIRCVWVEDDEGANIPAPLEPHLVTETSKGKFHKIFLVNGLSVEQHAQVQGVLVNQYGSDPNAKDVVRVLRVPGFYHMKGDPVMVRLIHESGAEPYTAEQVLEAFKADPNAPKRAAKTRTKTTPAIRDQNYDPSYVPLSEADVPPLPDINETNAADYLPEPGEQSYSEWRDVGMALHHQFGGSDAGLLIFDEWSQNVRNYQGFDDVQEKWANFGNRTDGPIRTFKSIIDQYNKTHKKAVAAGAATAADRAQKLLDGCEDYNLLVTDVAPRLRILAGSNVALEKDFVGGIIAKYAELRPGHTLTKPEAMRAMKTRREVPAAHGKNTVEDDDYVDEENAPKWVKNWVWVSEEEMFFNVRSRLRLTNSGFRAKYDCELPVGEGMPQDAARYVRNNRYLRIQDRTIYAPNFDPMFTHQDIKFVNTYSPLGRATIPDKIRNQAAVDIFKRHVENVFGGWNREAQIFCNFLTAVTAERPIKVRWAPLLIGVYGDGKSLFGTFIDSAVGVENSRTVSGQSIIVSASSGQTGWAEGCVFCGIEEVKFHGHNRHDALNLLKQYITNDKIPVKKLYKEIISVPNTQNYMLYSNYKDAAPIDKGDRRYFIHFSKLDLDALKASGEEGSYFDQLTDAVQHDAGDILFWLRTVPVHPDFKPNGHAPMTEDKRTVLRIVKDDLSEEVADMLEDSTEPLYGPKVVSFTPLFNAVMIRSNGAIRPNEKHRLTRVLLDLGFTKLDRCRLPISHDGDNRHTLWARVNVVGQDLESARRVILERYKKTEEKGLGIDDLL